MVSRNCSATKGSFGSTLLRYTFWSFHFFSDILFLKWGNYSFSKYHFGALGSDENISRCRHTIHTRIVSTSWCPYIICCTWKSLVLITFTSIRTVKKHVSYSLDFFRLVEEFDNWNMMRADKVIRPFFQSSHCNFEWSLGGYAIHRNHGVAACAGTQKLHLSGMWLPPRGWTVRR
jgi:hypothetical protein